VTANWWQGGLCALDTETTSVDIESARVVQIAFAIIRPAAAKQQDRVTIRTALIDPGVPVPAEASAVHGLTDDRLRVEGGKPAEVLDLYLGDVALAIVAGLPLVAMNAVFDLSILDREARRNGLPTITERLDGKPLAPVIDPLVIDTHVVAKRRRVSPTQGARQLKTLCQVWGVGWDDDMAHAAEYDAMQAARVVWRLCEKNPAIGAMSPMELHTKQVMWRAQQQVSFADWLVAKGEDTSGVDPAWPLRPFPEAVLDGR